MKASLALTFVVSLRFLGLFLVLPVISLCVKDYESSTNWAFLLGLAIGGAYLSQIIFQTPFGYLSDRINRKSVIIFGLIIFFIGSLVCGLAESMEMLVVGRFIQGAGAVGGVVSAAIADLTLEESRTKAMAIMGAGIFSSFTIAMLVGPIVGGLFGVKYLFFITAFLTLISIFVMIFSVKEMPKIIYSYDNKHQNLFKNKNLAIMNISSFLQKGFMTLAFMIIPLAFLDDFNLDKSELWKVYLPGAILGIFALAPATIIAEKKSKARIVMIYGIILFGLSFLLIGFGASKLNIYVFVGGIILFFIGFASLEPIMQSLASKYARASARGAALGIFTTYSFFGSFIGATGGAWIYYHFDLSLVCIVVCIICVLWLISMAFLDNPAKQKNLYLDSNLYDLSRLNEIEKEAGITECYCNQNENLFIVKYDAKILDSTQAQAIAQKIKK